MHLSRGMRFPTMCDQQRLRPACAYTQTDQSPCWSLKYSMTVKLLNKPHLRFLSLKGGCTCSSESTLVKMTHCWISRVTAHFLFSDGQRFNVQDGQRFNVQGGQRFNVQDGQRFNVQVSKPTNFLCDVCGKGFRLKQQLTQHNYIHAGYKPYQCQVCEKKFRRKDQLVRHALTMLGKCEIEGETFYCAVCWKGFKLKDNLEQHMLLHTGD